MQQTKETSKRRGTLLVSECVLGDESGTGNLQVDDEVVIVRNTVGLVVITRGTSVDGAEPNVAVVVEAQANPERWSQALDESKTSSMMLRFISELCQGGWP